MIIYNLKIIFFIETLRNELEQEKKKLNKAMRYVDRFTNRKGNPLSKSMNNSKQNTELDDENYENEQYSIMNDSNISKISNKNPFSSTNGQNVDRKYTEVISKLENDLQISRAETVNALNLLNEVGYNNGIKNEDVEKIQQLAHYHLSKSNKIYENQALSVNELWLLYKEYPLEELLHKLSRDVLGSKTLSKNVQGIHYIYIISHI